ncbi:HPP family protein [Labrys sp. 22185]|uniref:HPP family protein n=1 Tax=Labrys sp. 22185 TaxID=3453888 RepID=UPI003F8725A8
MALLPFKLFSPILAGATLRDRLFASLGAIVGIALTGLVCTLVFGRDPHLPFIVAPVGASAVLLFAVPASPLAQPWSIIGGNTLSALCGIAVTQFVHEPMLAIGLAVGLAIAVMSLARCLHPPGGAAALTAVIGGPAVAAAGFGFALVPVCLNSALLVALGWLFHRFSRHPYPHVPAPAPASTHGTADPAPSLRVGFRDGDIEGALTDLGETFDIDRQDLDRLLRRVEQRALSRSHADLTCADIMSRDIVTIEPEASAETAIRLLLEHNVRTLPVIDFHDRVVGTVGLRDLAGPVKQVGDVMTLPTLSTPNAPALGLVPALTDGTAHAVVIVDADKHIVGLVTQTDLLAALSSLSAREGWGQ